MELWRKSEGSDIVQHMQWNKFLDHVLITLHYPSELLNVKQLKYPKILGLKFGPWILYQS